jgi:DNA-binding NtrC family response regulator
VTGTASTKSVYALLLSNSGGRLSAVADALRKRGVATGCADSVAEALSLSEGRPVGLAVAHSASDADPEAAAAALLDAWPSTRLIAAGPSDDAEGAVRLMKLGAVDYLPLPLGESDIAALLDAHLMGLDAGDESESFGTEDERFGGGESSVVLIGRSSVMVRLRRVVRQLAGSRATVLCTGETGTGKEVAARAIHCVRRGPTAPFVAVNCAQVSGSLMESQLFGHVKGAFTGAVADNLGFFRAAEGGTLFLDEVSEMGAGLQAKLLRAIQEREVVPVGGTQPVSVDADIVAATNRDPIQAVEEGRLRKDLYYRLAEVGIHLPPLRERSGDVPRLVRWFIGRFTEQYGTLPKRLEPGVLEFLAAHDWPGNVRELESAVHRLFTLHPGQRSFLMSFAAGTTGAPASASSQASKSSVGRAKRAGDTAPSEDDILPLVEVEKDAIERAIHATRGNKSRAARLLGIERHTLSRRIKSFDLAVPSRRPDPRRAGRSVARSR